jgi:hypothetical protein
MRLSAALILIVVATPAAAHDVYTHLMSPSGRLCCGGDPVTGDCESVSYRMRPTGDVEVQSRRYNASVLVARQKITWSAVPGSPDEAHWCGKPRSAFLHDMPAETDDPDPNFHTFCAFIAPGGS